MNKKTLLIKIVEFIHKANIKYRKSHLGDIGLIVLLTYMFVFGTVAVFMTMFIFLCLRAIYEFNILKRLGVIYEEENNKKNDDQTTENIR